MTINTSSWQDPRYSDVVRYIQEGAWKPALQVLQDLQRDYPDEDDIQALIDSTRMRLDLDKKPVGGRSLIAVKLLQGRRLTRLAVVLLIVLMLIGGWYSYQRWVLPARLQSQQQALLGQTLSRAQQLLGEAAYAEAVVSFEEVLQMVPEHQEALLGLQEAQRQIRMANQYRDALNLIEQGDTISALTLLQGLRDETENYKDVDERIAQILQTRKVQEIFAEAEQVYLKGQWADAILLYNLIRQQNVTYQLPTVELRLFNSYMQLAGERMQMPGLGAAQLAETAELYRQALSVRPRDGQAEANLSLLNQYQQATDLMTAQQYNQSTPLLAALYANNPDFLGGDARRLLFNSRMGYGAQLEQEGKLLAALVQYNAAAVLPVEGALQARLRAETVARALMPTPTSTPTPTATPTPDPLEAVMKMFTPTPPPAPLEQYMGWIAFRSDRPSSRSGLWVMRPDGSEVLPASDPTGLYPHLIEQATWSPDNQRRIWVEDDGSGVSVAIYMWRYDVPAHWREARVELLNNSGINYHPAFSPDTQSIAFTSQRRAGPTDGDWGLWGDEIFIIHFADYNASGYVQPRRLTNNDWEWDKHPTFSPDGQTIAFWSNRISGRAQIWAMNVDGSNQRNLSNSEWNDWDPVWLVPRRELPQLKTDDGKFPVFDPALYDIDD